MSPRPVTVLSCGIISPHTAAARTLLAAAAAVCATRVIPIRTNARIQAVPDPTGRADQTRNRAPLTGCHEAARSDTSADDRIVVPAGRGERSRRRLTRAKRGGGRDDPPPPAQRTSRTGPRLGLYLCGKADWMFSVLAGFLGFSLLLLEGSRHKHTTAGCKHSAS